MNWVAILQAIVLGVVEGVTEFLPISSTGHQIIAADLMGFVGARAQAFNIIIQLAAILAVMWEFRKKITETIVTLPSSVQSQQFCLNLMIAFLPAGVLAIIFSSTIKLYLFNPITVSVALVLGGVVMLWAEKKTHTNSIEQLESIRWHHALKIGCVQSLALIPGTSRSASTIIGGLFFGLSRKVATEFSFFLAMPTMIAAALYSGYKYRDIFVLDDLPVFIAGFVTSFVFAMIAIKSLLKFIAHHSYAVFAWYRIIFGMLVLATWYFSWIEWSPI